MPNSEKSSIRYADQLIILAAIMFLAMLVALVVIVIYGKDTASLERIAGPVMTAVIITGVLGGATRSTNARLESIEEKAQTEVTAARHARDDADTRHAATDARHERQDTRKDGLGPRDGSG